MNNNSNFVKITDELIKNSQFDEAKQICDDILDSDNKNSLVWNQLGGIYFSKGGIIESQIFFNKAVESNENNIEALLNLAEIQSFIRDFKGALISYINILLISPNRIDVHNKVNLLQRYLSPDCINLLCTQIIDEKLDQNVFGSMPGSYPISGGYCTNLLPNWSTKFLADSLMLKLNPQKEFKYLS